MYYIVYKNKIVVLFKRRIFQLLELISCVEIEINVFHLLFGIIYMDNNRGKCILKG